MTTGDKERVAAKIRALFAKTEERGATPEEAAAARRQVMIKNPEDGLVENGTYDGDPSRDPRYPHGAGAFIATLFGAALLAAITFGVMYWRPLTTAWFGG